MFKSIFSKYFVSLSLVMISSFILLGALVLLFSNRYWKEDKQALLCENAENIARYAADNAKISGENEYQLDANLLPFLHLLVEALDAEAMLADNAGNILLCSESANCPHIGAQIAAEHLPAAGVSQRFVTGKLGGLFDHNRYIAAVPMIHANGEQLGYVLISSSSELSTQVTLNNLRMFALSAVVVWALFFIVLYVLTYRLVKPLRQMTEAARHFSSGDFTAQIAVSGKDEITELAQALSSMANSLSSAEGMRRSFIANVSHELRTPMTTISGFVDGVLDGTIPPEKHRQYLRVVSYETKRLSRLVHSMLALSRIDNGGLVLTKTTVDLTEVAGNVLLSFEQSFERKGLTVRCDEEPPAVTVQADRDMIGQVIYNLIENAVKFSDQGGEITVSTRAEANRGYFTVRNTGAGIAPEELPHIFDRFYKSDASRSLDKSGMGLGLFLVKNIITQHGGEITVRSLQGVYCEFEFWLG